MWLLAVTPLTSHLSPLQLLGCLLNLLRPPLEFLSEFSSKTTQVLSRTLKEFARDFATQSKHILTANCQKDT